MKTSDAVPAADAPGADARGRLLTAALRVLHEEGIHALTQTRVAVIAGLRQSHLTYYFPTRIDLLKAIIEHASGAVMALIGDGADSKVRKLSDIRTILCDQLADTRMPRLLMAMAAAADENPSLKAWMTAFELRIRKETTGAVVLFQTYSSFEECKKVAERLVEIGCPVPVIVEVVS